MAISLIRQGDMALTDTDIGFIINNIVTWDIAFFKIRQGTGDILSDRDMQH